MPQEDVLQRILERNKRVEMDKAWERSFPRRAFLAILTYVTVALTLWLLDQPLPLVIAIIPAGSYILQTLSLPWIRAWWMRSREK